MSGKVCVRGHGSDRDITVGCTISYWPRKRVLLYVSLPNSSPPPSGHFGPPASPEQVFHDISIVGDAASGQITGSKEDDSIEAVAMVTWEG